MRALLWPVLLLAATTAIAQQSDDAVKQRVLRMADEISARLVLLKDIYCVLRVRQVGTKSPDYIRNRIRTLEILTARGLPGNARAPVASEMAQLKRELSHPSSIESEEANEWRMRSDGLFWYTQASGDNRKAKTARNFVAYDGVACRWYDPQLKRAAILPKRNLPARTPEFGITVLGRRIDEFLKAAAEHGTVALAPSGEAAPTQPLVALIAWIPAPDNSGHLVANLLLDPAKGFLPMKIEQGRGSPGQVDSSLITSAIEDIVYQEVLPNLWYPVSAKYASHYTANLADPQTPPEQWKIVVFPSTAAVYMRLERIVVNQGLTEKDFQITIPDDVEVKRPAAANESLGGPAAKGEIVEITAVTDAGLAEPEATIRTLFWAVREGNLKQFQACYSGAESERLGQVIAERPQELLDGLRASWGSVRRYRIVSRQDTAPDRVVLKLAIEFQDARREPEMITLLKQGEVWVIDVASKPK